MPTPTVRWIEGPYVHVNNNGGTSVSPVKGDAQGKFSITTRDWESGVLLVTADAGAAIVGGVDFEAVSTVRLKPWSRIECSMPSTPDAEVSLSGSVTERSRVSLSYSCTLDHDGHGVFDRVMPCDYCVYRSPGTDRMRGGRMPTGQVTVLPGHTAEIETDPGRKVVLRLDIPDEGKLWLAKRRDGIGLRLTSANPPGGRPLQAVGNIWVKPDASGLVTIIEVAPGGYALQTDILYDPDTPSGTPLKRYFESDQVNFVVPTAKSGDDAPVDLGTVPMHFKGENALPEADAPPPGLLVDKLEGGTLSLQDLRGRYVLIDFWAVWCKPCEAQLPHLKQVWQEFGPRGDFVLLGLCLGEDLEVIRKFVAEHGSAWQQGVLTQGFDDPVAKQYGVTSLPHILLVGPDGKVVADNLLDDGIETAVRAALGAAKR